MFTRFSVYVRKFSNDSFLCVCAVIMDGLFSDEELFLTQNSFSEERVEDNFSIDCILDGLVGRIPETKAMIFNQCTFIISKD